MEHIKTLNTKNLQNTVKKGKAEVVTKIVVCLRRELQASCNL